MPMRSEFKRKIIWSLGKHNIKIKLEFLLKKS